MKVFDIHSFVTYFLGLSALFDTFEVLSFFSFSYNFHFRKETSMTIVSLYCYLFEESLYAVSDSLWSAQ